MVTWCNTSAFPWQIPLNHDLVPYVCRTMANMTESKWWLGSTHLQDYGRHDWITMLTWCHTSAELWQTGLKSQWQLGELHTLKSFAALAVLCPTTGNGDRETVPRWRDGPVESTPPATRHSQHGAWNSWNQGREKQSYCRHLLLRHRTTISSTLSFCKKTHVLPFPPWMKPKVNKTGWGEVDLTFPWNTAAHTKRQHSSPSNKPYISNYILWPLPFQEARRSPTTFQQPMYNTSMVHQTCSCNGMRVSKALQHTTNWLWQMTGTRKKKGRVQVTGAPCRWWRWFHSPPCPPLPRGSGCRPTRQTCTQKARQTGLIMSPGERMLHPQKSDSAHAFQRLNC